MRFAIACAFGAMLVAGCSGGADVQLSSAQLSGTVYEIDGQGIDLADVEVTLVETGERAWTDDGGAFAFDGLAPGVYTLDFQRPPSFAAMLAEEEPAGEAGQEETVGDGDEFEDGEGNPRVEVPADGGDIEIRVALDGDRVKDASVGSCVDRQAMARLHMTDQAELEGYHLGGVVKLIDDDGRERFKVCVEGLAPGDVIDLYLGAEPPQSIGSATAVAGEGDQAVACYSRDTGEGEDLPLGAPNLDELSGMRIEVRVGDLVLMVGEVPHLPDLTEPDHGDDEGEASGHDGDGEHAAEEPEPDGDGSEAGDVGEPDGAVEEPSPDAGTEGETGEGAGSAEEPI